MTQYVPWEKSKTLLMTSAMIVVRGADGRARDDADRPVTVGHDRVAGRPGTMIVFVQFSPSTQFWNSPGVSRPVRADLRR